MRQLGNRCFCVGLIAVLLLPVLLQASVVGDRENPVFETTAGLSGMYSVDAQWSGPLLSEIGAGPSSPAATYNGQGVKLGIVDTGVDVSVLVPGLVTEWIDVTEEGAVSLQGPFQISSSGTITFGGRTLNVSGIISKSGRLRAGTLDPASLPPGSPVRAFLTSGPLTVVAADTRLAGQYDTVFIDTNYDGSFATERGLERYRDSRAGVPVPQGTGGRALEIVLCEIRDGGKTVLLGFDGHGHGTSVASIIGGRAKGFVPMAPGAQVIAVKAVDSSGRTRWELLAQGILAACEKGAKIVLMSVAPLVPNESTGLLEEALRKAEKDYGALVVMASGNKGPGLGSLPAYADLPNVLTVGGFIPKSASAAMNVDGGKMWPWSSIGPTEGGGTVSVVGPALGPAQLPAWLSPLDQTWLFEGTSAAAAYAGGAAALVLGSDTGSGSMAPAVLKRLLEDGARPLAGYQAVEQGFGVIDVTRSIQLLSSGRGYPRVRAVARWGDKYQVGGFFDRNRIPGSLSLGIDSFNPFAVSLNLTLPSWIRADSSYISIPAVEQRETQLRIEPDFPVGLTSGYIKGDDSGTSGTDLAYLVTVIKPRQLGSAGAIGLQNVMDVGDYQREYVLVEPGLGGLSVVLEVPRAGDGHPRGRERLYVYDPQGWLVYEGPWVGAGEDVYRDEVYLTRPSAGVWEVVVVSDPFSTAYDATEAAFRLTLRRQGIAPVSQTRQLVATLAGGNAVGPVTLRNPGAAFSGVATVIEPGQNGEVIRERLIAPVSTSLTKNISGVTEGTRFIYLSATNPSDPSTKMDIFLYYYDKAAGRWTEVASSASLGDSLDRYVALQDPAPGQYIAYVEARNQQGGQTTFTWTQIVSRTAAGYRIREKETGSNPFNWPQASEVSLTVEVPGKTTTQPEKRTVYLTIWDEGTATLKAVMPLTVVSESPRPIVFLGEGSSFGNRTMVTISAYHPVTFRPLDAMVSVDGVWYQLRQGRATIILNRSDVHGIELVAEHPDLYPARVTVP